MKKLFILPLFAILALITSCSSDDNDGGSTLPPPPGDQVTSVDYYGEINMGGTIAKTRCNVVYNNAINVCDLVFTSIKFSDEMPEVKVRVAGIPCTVTAGIIEFHVPTPVVPEVGFIPADPSQPTLPSTPMPDFAMTGLAGAISSGAIEVSATLPLGELSFEGTIVPMFSGDMNVLAAGSDKVFTIEDIVCEVETSLDGTSATLFIQGAKFAESMPVAVDIKIENIPCVMRDNGFTFTSTDEIVPLVKMGGVYTAMPDFTFSRIEGEVGGTNNALLGFSATMTRGVFEYSGERFIKVIM